MRIHHSIFNAYSKCYYMSVALFLAAGVYALIYGYALGSSIYPPGFYDLGVPYGRAAGYGSLMEPGYGSLAELYGRHTTGNLADYLFLLSQRSWGFISASAFDPTLILSIMTAPYRFYPTASTQVLGTFDPSSWPTSASYGVLSGKSYMPSFNDPLSVSSWPYNGQSFPAAVQSPFASSYTFTH